MNINTITRDTVADGTAKMFQDIDKLAIITAESSYGIIGDLNTVLKVTVSQAATCMQISAGSFMTPNGVIGTFDDLVTGVFPHSLELSASGVVLATYTTNATTSTNEYGQTATSETSITATYQCISIDDYGDQYATLYPKSVVLAAYNIIEGSIDIDESNTVVANTRRAAGSLDNKHRNLGHSNYSTDRNVHGLQFDDLYDSSASFLKQAFKEGFMLGGASYSQGTPGTYAEVEIAEDAWQVDFLGRLTGKPGIYYTYLPSTPTSVATVVNADYPGSPVAVSWLDRQNILVTESPVHVYIRYTELTDFDLATPTPTSALMLRTNTNKLTVSNGTIRHTQSSAGTVRLGLDPYKDLVLNKIATYITPTGSIAAAPTVVETATVSTTLTGTALTDKVTFPTPSQVSFAIRGQGLQSVQEPPQGSLKVTNTRFIGTSNLTFTVSNDEEETVLTATVGTTVILTATDPLHPCGYLTKNGVIVSSSSWYKVDDYTVALNPIAHTDMASYKWILSAGESPRWLGRSIQAIGANATPDTVKASGYVEITAIPVAGDTITITTTDYEATFTYGTTWTVGTTVQAVAASLVSAIVASDVYADATAAILSATSAVAYVRITSRSSSSDSNNWTIEGSATETTSPFTIKSFYAGGTYAPYSSDLLGMTVSVLYQQTPYVKNPKINIYATKSIAADTTSSEGKIYHLMYTFDASDKKTVWRTHTFSRTDLVMQDYADRAAYDVTGMFTLGLTVSGYDAAGSSLSETLSLDEVDAWSPTTGYSDLAFKSTTNVYSSISSWIVSTAPPSSVSATLSVLSNLYDEPFDMFPVRAFKMDNGKAWNFVDTRRVMMGNAIAGEASQQEQMHQALSMQNDVLTVSGLL